MSVTRSALAIAATVMLGLLLPAAAFAADLTIPAGAAATQKRGSREPGASNIQKKTATGHRRAEKRQRPGRRISTYNLADPAHKYGTGISGRTRFSPGNGSMGLGTGLDYTNPAAAPTARASNGLSGMPLGTGFKADAANSSGSNADCRDKPANLGPGRREMSACFVHKLDKSWNAQTYVSRRSADGNTGWGGGLAVGYNY